MMGRTPVWMVFDEIAFIRDTRINNIRIRFQGSTTWQFPNNLTWSQSCAPINDLCVVGHKAEYEIVPDVVMMVHDLGGHILCQLTLPPDSTLSDVICRIADNIGKHPQEVAIVLATGVHSGVHSWNTNLMLRPFVSGDATASFSCMLKNLTGVFGVIGDECIFQSFTYPLTQNPDNLLREFDRQVSRHLETTYGGQTMDGTMVDFVVVRTTSPDAGEDDNQGFGGGGTLENVLHEMSYATCDDATWDDATWDDDTWDDDSCHEQQQPPRQLTWLDVFPEATENICVTLRSSSHLGNIIRGIQYVRERELFGVVFFYATQEFVSVVQADQHHDDDNDDADVVYLLEDGQPLFARDHWCTWTLVWQMQ
jgi:hypothetical protein